MKRPYPEAGANDMTAHTSRITPSGTEEPGSVHGRLGAQIKAAPPELETPTGPSRKTSTDIPGGDGRMTHPTRKTPPSDTLDDCPCPYCDVPSIGDLLPDVLAEMRRRETL